MLLTGPISFDTNTRKTLIKVYELNCYKYEGNFLLLLQLLDISNFDSGGTSLNEDAH